MQKSWYEIKAQEKSADIYIYDEIGFWGITASQFVRDLKALKGKALNVFINSPGGDVFDAVAIYNALARHAGGVSVTVDGLAASAASVIAQAGETRKMATGSAMMIHDAWGIAVGNEATMEQRAGELNKVSDLIADIYAERAGGEAEDWRQAMRDETWYNPAEAVAAGLADSMSATAATAYAGQVFNLSKFKKVPGWVNRSGETSNPADKPGEEPAEEGGSDMDLTAIRAQLGIGDEDDVGAAVTSLQAQVATLTATLNADAPEKGEAARLRTELQEANQRLLEADAAHNRDTLQLREKLRTLEAEARVDKAIAQGRVTPANREYALKVALAETADGWDKFVRTLPSVNLKELGTAGGFEYEAFEPTQAEISVARQMGAWNDDDPEGSRQALMRAKGAKIPAAK